MDKLQKIKEKTDFNHFHMPEEGRFSLAFNLRKDDFDWLIQTIEQQQKEIERLHKLRLEYAEDIDFKRNQLQESNIRIQFLEGLRSAQA